MPDASGGAHNTQSDVSETFGGTPDEPGETPDESGETPDENTPPDAQITYELMSRTYSEIYLGDLIVVNNSHIYTFPTVSMENVTNYRERVDGTLPYLIPNINDPPQMQSEAARQLSAMLTQYYRLSGDDNLVVYDAYRTEE